MALGTPTRGKDRLLFFVYDLPYDRERFNKAGGNVRKGGSLDCRADRCWIRIGFSVQALAVRQRHWPAISTAVRNPFMNIYEMTGALSGPRYNHPFVIELALTLASLLRPAFRHER